MKQADSLLAEIEKSAGDQAANDLLSAFFAGYPVSNLQRLLGSQDERVVKIGAWIASELGERAGELLPLVPPLLAHPVKNVRFYMLDVVLCCAGSDEGDLIARAARLVCDHDEAVQWKAMTFFARASVEQLAAGAANQSDEKIQVLTKWLLEVIADPTRTDDIKSGIESGDSLERVFGAIAAVRVAEVSGSTPTRFALGSMDERIRSFVADHVHLDS